MVKRCNFDWRILHVGTLISQHIGKHKVNIIYLLELVRQKETPCLLPDKCRARNSVYISSSHQSLHSLKNSTIQLNFSLELIKLLFILVLNLSTQILRSPFLERIFKILVCCLQSITFCLVCSFKWFRVKMYYIHAGSAKI